MNLLQSAALLIGMVSVLSLLGWIFAGANGMLWAFFVSIGILMISPNLSPRLILGLYSAKPLSPNRAPRLYPALKTFRTHPNTGERVKRLLTLSHDRQLIQPHAHPLPGMSFNSHTPVTIPIRHHFKRRYCGPAC